MIYALLFFVVLLLIWYPFRKYPLLKSVHAEILLAVWNRRAEEYGIRRVHSRALKNALISLSRAQLFVLWQLTLFHVHKKVFHGEFTPIEKYRYEGLVNDFASQDLYLVYELKTVHILLFIN